MTVAEINGKPLDDIAKINGVTVIGLGDALVGEVMDGKFFYAGSTTLLEGTLATVALLAASGAYPAGYHAGNVGGLVAIDEHLVAGQIKKDTVIFGVTGTFEQTPSTTELFFITNTFMMNIGTSYVVMTDLTGLVPDSAVLVECVAATTGLSTGYVGDMRVTYNGVEKATEEVLEEGFCNIVRWAGAGLGSAATLRLEIKMDDGLHDVSMGGVGWYQELA